MEFAKRFVVINASGKILRKGQCMPDDIAIQAREGEIAFELLPDQETFNRYWKSGQFIEYPEKPGEWAVFDYVAGVWADPRTSDDLTAELEAFRASAIAQVNAIVGRIRAQFITVIPGQEMLYLLKEQEAIEWLQASDADMKDFPLIAAEVGITGETAYDVATTYVYQGRALRMTAAPLETARLGAVAQIETAQSIEAIEAVLAGFMSTW